MELTYLQHGIDAVIIDDFYPKNDHKIVLEECKKLIPHLVEPQHTGGAKDATGKFYIKENSGIFIDDKNKIFYINANITTSDRLKEKLIEFNPMWKIYSAINSSDTLVSYYKESDYYDKHIDTSTFTILVWLNTEPKKFSGGDLTLYSTYKDITANIEYKNNRAVIFPSCTPHSVSPVKTLDGFNDGDGRFCISHFLNYVDPRKLNDSN